jgi:diacylglycerol kinase (ATP)
MATPVQIVMTPGSGDGRAVAIARDVRKQLVKEGYAPRMQAFRTLDELIRWTRDCPADFSYLVAVGGDATVSAASAAAIRLSVPYVPVPSGFGNLFTAAFEHPSDPVEVAALLSAGDLVWSDVGVSRSGGFLSHQSYGFLSNIQEEVEHLRRQSRQRYLRLLSYYRMAAKHMSDTSLDAIQVEIDGHPLLGKAALVTIANVETYRGFLSLTPAASPVDGFLDVCVIARTTPARVLAQLIKVMLDVPGARDEISVYRGRHIRVRVNRRRPEDVRVRVGVLPLLVPVGSLDRLQARQVAAQGDAPVTTPPLLEPVASALVPAGTPELPDQSRPPVEVA